MIQTGMNAPLGQQGAPDADPRQSWHGALAYGPGRPEKFGRIPGMLQGWLKGTRKRFAAKSETGYLPLDPTGTSSQSLELQLGTPCSEGQVRLGTPLRSAGRVWQAGECAPVSLVEQEIMVEGQSREQAAIRTRRLVYAGLSAVAIGALFYAWRKR